MKYIRRDKKVIVAFLISIILFVNINSIIIIQTFFNKSNDLNKNINDIPSLIPNSSNGPPNKNYFEYYKEIIIDHGKVSGTTTLVNFPVLISIYDSDLHDKVQDDGDDIAFSNGTVWLDHEIELFNQTYNITHAQLVVWVNVPSLSTVIDTKLTMYYGNATMSSRQNVIGVWDSNYKAIWHLKENPSETPPQFKDSTSNDNDGTAISLSSSNQVAGKIDGSLIFDNSNERCVNVSDHFSLQLSTDMTISAWIKTDNNDQYVNCLITKWSPTPGNQNYWLGKLNENYFAFYVNSSETVNVSLNLINDNNWHYVIGVADSSNNLLKVYIDGTEQNTTVYSGSSETGSNFLNIGRSSGIIEQEWDGIIDEVRISNVARSADWIATEYNNQYGPNTFYSISKEYTISGIPPNEHYFKYFKDIIIDYTKISGSHDFLNFPLLISTFDEDLHNKAQEDGDDIAFEYNGAWLDYEIEFFNRTYNSTHAQLIAWVSIPRLSTSENTVFRMYYGNSTMGSSSNYKGVWDNNYVMVHHMEETSNSYLDSTKFGNNGSGNGVDVSSNGKIDGAGGFDGLNYGDIIDVSHSSSLLITDEITIELWFKTLKLNDYQYLIDKRDSNSPSENWFLGLWNNNTIRFELFGVGNTRTYSTSTININNWYHLVATYNGTSKKIFINGAMDKEEAANGTIITNTHNLNIGTNWLTVYTLEGLIDEVRISNLARSADWIETEFNNQHEPNSFYSIGEEYLTLKPESFQYYKEIIIDHTKVSSDLVNFPLLISLFDSDLQDHTQDDGDDIAFYYGNGWLDHELELFNKFYNGTHAQLVSWVRIPFLSNTTDTKITMYYGNSTVESQENPTGVWDENHCFVLHMNQDPSSSDILDSTSNGFDFNVEISGSMASDDLVNGQTGKAISFDGVDDYIYLPISKGFSGPIDKMTFEFWLMFPDGWTPAPRDYVGAPAIASGDPYLSFYNYFEFHIETDSGHVIQSTQATFNAGTWYHFSAVWDGTGVGLHRIYISGSIETDDSSPPTGTHAAWNTFSIGAEDDYDDGPGGSESDHEIKAIISEFRLSKAVRSAYWIATEYNNQKNPHSFYSVSSEKSPDSSPPTYTNLIESSDPLELGDTEIISINVSDPSGINQVKIEFSGSNHSMNNIGGDTWQYDSWIPSSIGNYSYTIWMEDNYSNWNSSVGNIEVIDTTPPTYSDLIESADPLQLGQNETISIKVYDSPGSGINQVLLEYDSFNHTMNFIGGNTWTWSNWKPVSVEDHSYKIFMQDMENNWNMTSGSITVVETTAPVIENLTKSEEPLELGNNITISVDVYDNDTSVSAVLIELDNANYTMDYTEGNTYEYTWTRSWVGMVIFVIYANDSLNNWNTFSGSFDIVDTTAPVIENLTKSEDPLELGHIIIISVNSTDLADINQALIEYEDSYRIISNHTMTNVAGDIWQYNSWTPGPTTGNWSYTIWVEDNNYNWAFINDWILVQDTTPPIYSDLTEIPKIVELGDLLTISINATDLAYIKDVSIEYEASNHTMMQDGDIWWYNSWAPNSIGNYTYTIYITDNNDNLNYVESSILFQDTKVPVYSNLFESADPLELGNSPIIRIDLYDFAGINQTFIEFEGANHSMTNIYGDTWQFDLWTPDNWIIYQYKIYIEDKSGNWNLLLENITVQDTTPPSPPTLTNSPSGDVRGTLLFDWADGFDYSGISYYILIIDNESDPFATPGYVYFTNITNLGSESSYCELSDILSPGRYYYFLYQIDGAGHQSSSTIGTFTVVSANNFLILVIIIAIIIGSITTIVIVKKKAQKKATPPKKKIRIKGILQHIDKISILQTISKPDEILKDKVEIEPWETEEVKDLGNLNQIDLDLMEIKTLGEELFNEGAYLEAQKQFELAKNMLLDSGRNEEAKLFSELIEGIKGLTDKRENLLKILERVKIEGNMIKMFEIYYDLIQISKKLRDSDAVAMYQSEFIQIFQSDNLKLIELEDYRIILEEQIKSLLIENDFEMVAQFYEKCEMISEILVQLGKEEEKFNVEKFKNKKNEYLSKK